jgi:hypothetical protein
LLLWANPYFRALLPFHMNYSLPYHSCVLATPINRPRYLKLLFPHHGEIHRSPPPQLLNPHFNVCLVWFQAPYKRVRVGQSLSQSHYRKALK